MNRTQALCRALGWAGGTIHQVAKEFGVSSTALLYDDADRNHDAYRQGFKDAKSLVADETDPYRLPLAAERAAELTEGWRGNLPYWLGVAERIMLLWANGELPHTPGGFE